ncbi:MAG: DNA polymerase ligase N-terminal domain-containing protein [Candidatus Babeliales bacterium]|nr:DNA polymerase ligase N-terminal domain-containing protein [Candidatus Babeliales bacterium]
MRSYLVLLLFLNGFVMAAKKDLLKEYKQKRDFKKTTEPQGLKKVKLKHPIYVIQKHNASHLHYDLRLEIDGVLKSWAVPKGPSLDPDVKRLAVETEDHPIDYADFEGVIPEGYGAGTVMVWDIGTFKNLKPDQDIKEDYENGKLEVFLEGEKLTGAFVLIKTHLPGSGKANWLLKKMDDEHASLKKNPVGTQYKSVLSNRTTAQITKESQNDLSLMRKIIKKVSKTIENTKKKLKL